MNNILVFEQNHTISDYLENNFCNYALNKDCLEYDLAIINTDVEVFPFEIKTKCLLISENINLNSVDILAKQIISVGMSSRSTVCFSSIDENKAFLCIQRQIDGFLKKEGFPCEIPCSYNNKMSVSENIICCLAQMYLSHGDNCI